MPKRRKAKQTPTERPCRDCARPIVAPYATYCPDCRWRHRCKKRLYAWTPERETYMRAHYESRPGVPDKIAAVFGWPSWVVKRKVRELGLSRPTWKTTRQTWTDADLAFLEAHLGTRTVNWIAKQLHRSLTSVVVKTKRLGMSRILSDCYTARAVALGFGVDDHVVTRWITQGLLDAEPAPYALRSDGRIVAYQVSPEALQRFVREQPTAYRLDRVDQLWFLDLVFEGRVGGRAAAAA